jgi:hypothetical protein
MHEVDRPVGLGLPTGPATIRRGLHVSSSAVAFCLRARVHDALVEAVHVVVRCGVQICREGRVVGLEDKLCKLQDRAC